MAFVFGGYTVGGLSNDLQILALDSLRWEEVVYSGFGPSPRQGHAAARHGDSLVVVGGCQVSPAECFGDVYSLDAKTLAWTPESSDKVMFSPREGHTASFIRGHLVVIGGCELFKSCYNDVTVLDTGDPCASNCGAQGACEGEGPEAYCQCHPGFGGYDCLTPVPCPFKCHGHGQCLSTGRCACDNGFGGASCEVDFQCPGNGNCNGQGRCQASGSCACFNGFSGGGLLRGGDFLPAGLRLRRHHAARDGPRGHVGLLRQQALQRPRHLHKRSRLQVQAWLPRARLRERGFLPARLLCARVL